MSPNEAVLLIDADVLAVAGASTAEQKDDDGNPTLGSFEQVGTWIDNMVYGIMEACNSKVLFMFLTGNDNFRYDIATVKPYKANRKTKPYHTENARAYIRSKWGTYISKGCEADDLLAMSMESYRKDDVPCILCTVDKDLLQVEGWHYKWEGWNFPEVKPHFVEHFGKLEMVDNKVVGEGYIWFCYQALTGDVTDNIPGLPGCGPKGAYKALCEAVSDVEALDIVRGMYEEKYGEEAIERLSEQARLVWMIRERDPGTEDGLLHWNLETANGTKGGED